MACYQKSVEVYADKSYTTKPDKYDTEYALSDVVRSMVLAKLKLSRELERMKSFLQLLQHQLHAEQKILQLKK